jgi:TRAP-type C4-dicarboxylate transport system permease small subunit
VIDAVLRTARWVGAAIFVAIFAVFIAAVFMRYVVAQPIQWADEFVTIAAMWLILWMSAFVIRERDHVSVDIVFLSLAPRTRRWIALFSAVFFGGVFAAAIPSVLDYVLFLWRQRTNVLEWRLDFVFMCLPLFFAAVVVRSLAAAARLLSKDWPREVAGPAEAAAEAGPRS